MPAGLWLQPVSLGLFIHLWIQQTFTEVWGGRSICYDLIQKVLLLFLNSHRSPNLVGRWHTNKKLNEHMWNELAVQGRKSRNVTRSCHIVVLAEQWGQWVRGTQEREVSLFWGGQEKAQKKKKEALWTLPVAHPPLPLPPRSVSPPHWSLWFLELEKNSTSLALIP